MPFKSGSKEPKKGGAKPVATLVFPHVTVATLNSRSGAMVGVDHNGRAVALARVTSTVAGPYRKALATVGRFVVCLVASGTKCDELRNIEYKYEENFKCICN